MYSLGGKESIKITDQGTFSRTGPNRCNSIKYRMFSSCYRGFTHAIEVPVQPYDISEELQDSET